MIGISIQIANMLLFIPVSSQEKSYFIFSHHEIWKKLSVKCHEIHCCSGSLIWSQRILCVGFAVLYSVWIDWKFNVEGKAVILKVS